MKTKKLGSSDIEIAPLVFGGNVFGWTLDEKKSFTLLDALVERGINMIDTANVYSVWVDGNKGGESEQIIGNWLSSSGKRSDIVLASKVGQEMGDGSKGLSRTNIIQSVEKSLKRLNTDYIDVYYAHIDDESVPLAETLAAFDELIKAGKVRTIASSNYSATRLSQALKISEQNNLPKFIAHQPEYNLFDRDGYEGDLEQVCSANGLGVVTYFSLASGYLTGKYRTPEDLKNSQRGQAFIEKYATAKGERILAALNHVADRYQVPEAAVALAWIMQRPSVTAPIASATSVAQLDQLVKATELHLDANAMEELTMAEQEPKEVEMSEA